VEIYKLSAMELLWFLLVGAVSGWLAGQLWKGSGFGLIGNIIVGVLGSVVGGWLAGKLGIGGSSLVAHILISAGGAWVLLFLISLIKNA
ncbi:MAG TPA: GlsB/YeaQ/YmgE family stress response membrane protein, partial [Phnomibacter sp.]|nr:GlsB/YeaQ/YmgE family stress response membrane protein [Phnomibacter sp.]